MVRSASAMLGSACTGGNASGLVTTCVGRYLTTASALLTDMPMKAFGGDGVVQLVSKIRQYNAWTCVPIGPIGSVLSLQNDIWARAVEASIGSFFNNFIVDNDKDLHTLNVRTLYAPPPEGNLQHYIRSYPHGPPSHAALHKLRRDSMSASCCAMLASRLSTAEPADPSTSLLLCTRVQLHGLACSRFTLNADGLLCRPPGHAPLPARGVQKMAQQCRIRIRILKYSFRLPRHNLNHHQQAPPSVLTVERLLRFKESGQRADTVYNVLVDQRRIETQALVQVGALVLADLTWARASLPASKHLPGLWRPDLPGAVLFSTCRQLIVICVLGWRLMSAVPQPQSLLPQPGCKIEYAVRAALHVSCRLQPATANPHACILQSCSVVCVCQHLLPGEPLQSPCLQLCRQGHT